MKLPLLFRTRISQNLFAQAVFLSFFVMVLFYITNWTSLWDVFLSSPGAFFYLSLHWGAPLIGTFGASLLLPRLFGKKIVNMSVHQLFLVAVFIFVVAFRQYFIELSAAFIYILLLLALGYRLYALFFGKNTNFPDFIPFAFAFGIMGSVWLLQFSLLLPISLSAVLPWLVVFSGGNALVLVFEKRKQIRHFLQRFKRAKIAFSVPAQLSTFLMLLLAFYLSIIFLNSLLPESRTDALYFHLHTARELLQNHSPLTTGLPFGLSALVLPLVWFDVHQSARLLIYICLFFILSLLFRKVFRREENSLHSPGVVSISFLLGASLFLSVPVVTWTASSVYADIPMLFFYFLGLCVMFNWLSRKEAAPKILLLAWVIFLGSMLFKYQAFFYAVLWIPVVVWFSYKQKRKLPVSFFLKVFFTSAFLLLPFFLFNIKNYSNPLAPYSLLSPVEIVQSNEVYLGDSKTSPPLQTFWRVITYPEGTSYGGVISPALLFGFLLFLNVSSKKKDLYWASILLSCVSVILWIYSGVQDVRYLLPVLLLSLFWAAEGLEERPFALQRWWVAAGLLLICIHIPSLPPRYPYVVWPIPWQQIFLKRSELEPWYKRAHIPSYSALEEARKSEGFSHWKVLSTNDPHLFYFPLQSRYSINDPYAVLYQENSASVLQAAESAGYTHFYVSSLFHESWRWKSYPDLPNLLPVATKSATGTFYSIPSRADR